MKKIERFIISICALIIASCSYEGDGITKGKNSFDENVSQSNDVQSIFENNIQNETAINAKNVIKTQAQSQAIKQEPQNTQSPTDYRGKEIDIDLTTMSPLLVYGEVFNMVENPNKYIGKIIKLEGYYTSFEDTYNDKYYFFISIEDALACCAQGVEFVFDEAATYPTDYPQDGSYIEFVGEFDVYQWQGYTFFRIKTDRVVVL